MDGRACNQQPVRENEISERMIHHLRTPPIRIRMLSRQLSRYVALENRNYVKFQFAFMSVDHMSPIAFPTLRTYMDRYKYQERSVDDYQI